MSQPLVICPVCGTPNCVEVADDVDIGVGTLRNVTGYECPECGKHTVFGAEELLMMGLVN